MDIIPPYPFWDFCREPESVHSLSAGSGHETPAQSPKPIPPFPWCDRCPKAAPHARQLLTPGSCCLLGFSGQTDVPRCWAAYLKYFHVHSLCSPASCICIRKHLEKSEAGLCDWIHVWPLGLGCIVESECIKAALSGRMLSADFRGLTEKIARLLPLP